MNVSQREIIHCMNIVDVNLHLLRSTKTRPEYLYKFGLITLYDLLYESEKILENLILSTKVYEVSRVLQETVDISLGPNILKIIFLWL